MKVGVFDVLVDLMHSLRGAMERRTSTEKTLMGQYINPPSLVKEKGRKVQLGTTLKDTEAALRPGEKLATLTKRGFGNVALVISGEGDFRAVAADKKNLLGLYAVGPEVLQHAS